MSPFFPFGQPLHPVAQIDRTPKEVFVLGVYASAVHARWCDKDGNQLVAALAIASEPEIFWRGDDAETIIAGINIPAEAGTLTVPTYKQLNGPSGRTLDELFLAPLGYNRSDAWLCDLLPASRVNPKQRIAIDTHYTPLCEMYNLPKASIPDFKKEDLNSALRREEILKEFIESQANTLILLGDLPIKWFLDYYTEKKYSRLAEFGETNEKYGLAHEMKVAGRSMNVVPLCHPRQAGKLGTSSDKWGKLHGDWVQKRK